MIKRVIFSSHQSKSNYCSVNFSVDLVVLPIIQQEGLMKWPLSRVTRTRIRVIGVNFSEILIKRREI